MSAIAAHIRTAREHGPKAGFNAYMRTNAPTARERQDEIRSAGNKKEQFKVYCAIFSDQLGTTPSAATRSNDQRESVLEKIARKLGVSTGELSELVDEDDDEVGVQVEAPARTTRTNTRKPNAAKLIVGSEFLYHGTNNVSEWEVIKVRQSSYRAKNANGRESNWKISTVEKLVKDGKIDLV